MKWNVRVGVPSDADALRNLMLQIAQTTDFMMFEPREVPEAAILERRIRAGTKNASEVLFVVKGGDDISGYMFLCQDVRIRGHGVGTIAMGVHPSMQAKGVGSSLVTEAIMWAKQHAFYRLQLQVQTSNSRAVRLYEKFGFETEGTFRRSICIRGEYRDKYQMVLFLDGNLT